MFLPEVPRVSAKERWNERAFGSQLAAYIRPTLRSREGTTFPIIPPTLYCEVSVWLLICQPFGAEWGLLTKESLIAAFFFFFNDLPPAVTFKFPAKEIM